MIIAIKLLFKNWALQILKVYIKFGVLGHIDN